MSRPLLPDSFLERFGADLYHCSSCNYCVDAAWSERGIDHVCATLEHHSPATGYSGRGFIEAARALAEGIDLDRAVLGERVFACTACGNCETVCPIGLRPAAIGHALRDWLGESDNTPVAVARARAQIVRDGRAPALTSTVAEARPVAASRPGGAALDVFSGCALRVSPAGVNDAVREVLARAGVGVNLLAEDACCGAALAELGVAGAAAQWRERVLEGAADLPVLLVGGYECLHHLQGQAGERALTSLVAWLCERITTGALQLRLKPDAPQPLRVFALESCQLKRRPERTYLADEQRFRALLDRLGVVVVNASYPAPHQLCCGAGGGMPTLHPTSARAMADARRAEADDVICVSLDPRCAAHLNAAPDASSQVLGFAEFILGYCELTRAPGGGSA